MQARVEEPAGERVEALDEERGGAVDDRGDRRLRSIALPIVIAVERLPSASIRDVVIVRGQPGQHVAAAVAVDRTDGEEVPARPDPRLDRLAPAGPQPQASRRPPSLSRTTRKSRVVSRRIDRSLRRATEKR